MVLRPFLWRAKRVFPDKEIVSYANDGVERYTYAEYAERVAQLAHALDRAGIGQRDRIGTLGGNHHRHFESYFAVPNIGAQLHTINPALPQKHLDYIIDDAADQLLLVDPAFCEQLAEIEAEGGLESVEQVVVMSDSVPSTVPSNATDFESFVAGHPTSYEWPEVDRTQPAGLCYTSGTTGKPKGVEYTHEMTWSQIMVNLTPYGHYPKESDKILQLVPMAHINGWCLPYEGTAVGAEHVYPGRSPDPAHLAELIEEENVTYSAGVPTVWMQILEYAETHGTDLSSLNELLIGGDAAPVSVMRTFDKKYGVRVRHAYGATEMNGIASVSVLKSEMNEWDDDRQYEKYRTQGLSVPGLEIKGVDLEDSSEIPWDGETEGELYVRAPWVTTEYFQNPEKTEENFDGDWFKTGDVVTIGEDGYIEIVDRRDDLIKSGGEWISSMELETSMMDLNAVSEATVIPVPDERWGERPASFVAPSADYDGTQQELVEEIETALASEYPKWWIPDNFEFLDEIPKTATGKFDKKLLRDDE
jgi:fatty-acyl-CoA synthase